MDLFKSVFKWGLAFAVAVGFIFLFKGGYDLLTGDLSPLQMFLIGLGIVVAAIFLKVTKLSEIPKWLLKKIG